MNIRPMAEHDISSGRLRALVEKRVSSIPSLARLTTKGLEGWIEEMMFARDDGAEMGGENIPVLLVADDGAQDLAGVFVAQPLNILGAPVPIMADLLIVTLRAGAMEAMVDMMESYARAVGCASISLTCESSLEVAGRWGARFGARPVAVSLFKEL